LYDEEKRMSESVSGDVQGDIPTGAAPSFGAEPPSSSEAGTERLVLTADAHHRLTLPSPLAAITGAFTDDPLGSGHLAIETTELPGVVHIHADVRSTRGPAFHIDANVRESWLLRLSGNAEAAPVRGQVVRELIELAALPRQSTVLVTVEK